MDDELWDVFIPEGTGDNYGELAVGGNQFVIKPILRNILINNEQIQISGTKLRAGSQGVTTFVATKKFLFLITFT